MEDNGISHMAIGIYPVKPSIWSGQLWLYIAKLSHLGVAKSRGRDVEIPERTAVVIKDQTHRNWDTLVRSEDT